MTRVDGALARRRFLTALGAGGVVGVAGCLGETGDEEPAGDDADDERHRYALFVDHSGDEPIEFTDDQNCPVCNMTPRDYPRWQCQLAHENGDGAVFDTPGCLFAYYATPPTDSPVVGAWVTGLETEDLVDATEASFVLVTDEEATREEPMGPNPRPFADREDALAYAEEWDAEDLTDADVIELADVDYETAARFRGGRMPDR